MERELVRFIGTGLTVMAAGLGAPRPSGLDGYALIDHLLPSAGRDLERLVAGCVRDIWRSWRRAKLPGNVARDHVIGMTMLLDACAPDPQTVLAAMVAAGSAPPERQSLARKLGREPTGGGAARHLATLVVRSGVEVRAFDGTEINPQLTFFLLERLFQHLLAERQLVCDLKPLIEIWMLTSGAAAADPLTSGRAAGNPRLAA